MFELRRVALLLSLSLSAFAQDYPEPANVAEPHVVCTGCPGTNSAGEPNDGKPLVAYDSPLGNHVGRYVSSSSTPDVGHLGMRTIRAGQVRAVLSRNRLYMKLNTTLVAYRLATFFSGRLSEPLVAVNTIGTGFPYSGRSPFEKLAKPDAFVYPEATTSGWQTTAVAGVDQLADFDVDDRGYVYYGSRAWGFGIHFDDGRTATTHLPLVVQVQEPATVKALFSFKNGTSYYLLVSNDDTTARLYDVTNPASPALLGTRAAFDAWSKTDNSGHVALRDTAGVLRVYTYAAVVANGSALAEFVPDPGQKVRGFSYEDTHTDTPWFGHRLWLTQAPDTGGGATLWHLPTATYEKVLRHVFQDGFRPDHLHAIPGAVAIAGGGELRHFVRRFDTSNVETLEELSAGYFRSHYHSAPAGFAQPEGFMSPVRPYLFDFDGYSYLFYAANGLGDVYELRGKLRSTHPDELPVPANFSAFAGGQNRDTVKLVWDPVPEATNYSHYENFRLASSSDEVGDVNCCRKPDTAYLYAVKASNHMTGAVSPKTHNDLAVTVNYADVAIVPGMKVRKAHLADVRRGVNAVRKLAGLPPAVWTESTTIRAVHIEELRAALNAGRTALGLPAWTFTDPSLAGLKIKAVHMQELMDAMN